MAIQRIGSFNYLVKNASHFESAHLEERYRRDVVWDQKEILYRLETVKNLLSEAKFTKFRNHLISIISGGGEDVIDLTLDQTGTKLCPKAKYLFDCFNMNNEKKVRGPTTLVKRHLEQISSWLLEQRKKAKIYIIEGEQFFYTSNLQHHLQNSMKLLKKIIVNKNMKAFDYSNLVITAISLNKVTIDNNNNNNNE